MLGIIVDASHMNDGNYIGQYEDKVVIEVETAPEFDYEDISNTTVKFLQRKFKGVYKEKVTYSEYVKLKQLIDTDGESDSFLELIIDAILSDRTQIAELQNAVAEAEVI